MKKAFIAVGLLMMCPCCRTHKQQTLSTAESFDSRSSTSKSVTGFRLDSLWKSGELSIDTLEITVANRLRSGGAQFRAATDSCCEIAGGSPFVAPVIHIKAIGTRASGSSGGKSTTVGMAEQTEAVEIRDSVATDCHAVADSTVVANPPSVTPIVVTAIVAVAVAAFLLIMLRHRRK